MIQRIQSLYMFLAIAAIVLTFLIPIGKMADGVITADVTPYGVYDSQANVRMVPDDYLFYIPLALALILTVLSFFSYNDRKAQIKYLKLTFFLFAVTFVLMALYINDVQSVLQGMTFSLSAGFFFPLLSVVFNWLAAKAIRKDENLVRSVDRIR